MRTSSHFEKNLEPVNSFHASMRDKVYKSVYWEAGGGIQMVLSTSR